MTGPIFSRAFFPITPGTDMSTKKTKKASGKSATSATKSSMKSPRKTIPAVKSSVTKKFAAKAPAGSAAGQNGGKVAADKKDSRVAAGKKDGRVAAGKKDGRVAAMWAGRFSQAMSPSMEMLSVSLPFDKKLFREDIEG